VPIGQADKVTTYRIESGVTRTVVIAIVFFCLGHFTNVYDDDDGGVAKQVLHILLPLAATLH